MEIFWWLAFVGRFVAAVILLLMIGVLVNLCLFGWAEMVRRFAHALRFHSSK